ncbi:NTP transferase domain-containing protein [Rubrobacter calidifluminis]|uniref:NTP transferase domain-containing protein n=1 Tax=Rubrobacter calidifluminis TaxID=1392640 RepID=UPI0023617EAF|nr:NTP transferase domain-containing protein [Rubrobacter calidifluminis]
MMVQETETGAAVLAAGFGERMRDCGRPKPLVRVGGLTLLERTVRTLRAGGLEGPVVVVVGYRAEEVSRFCEERDLAVRVVENPDYPRGNGTSVLAAIDHLPERFVVSMVDHVHSPEAVRRLLVQRGEFVAAVDSRPLFADPAEATRVRLRGGGVVDFGKGLTPYDALDAGLFLCSRSVLQKLSGEEDGPLSWNELKRRWLAQGGRIEAVDLDGAPWTDVDTPADIERALEAILSWAASGNDGFVSRHFNRRLSRRVTRRLLGTPVAPDHVSLASFALAAAGAFSILRGRMRLGGALVQLSSVVDGCDGELARARLESSPRGGVLDAVLDRWSDALVISALAARRRSAQILGYPALAGALLVPYTRARWEATIGKIPRSFTGLGATRDVRLAILALGALLGRPAPALGAVALLSNVEVVRRLAGLPGF